MPHRRPRKKGSFGSELDELVTQFPAREHRLRDNDGARPGRSPELQEKIDIHALLFERAWQLDRDDG